MARKPGKETMTAVHGFGLPLCPSTEQWCIP